MIGGVAEGQGPLRRARRARLHQHEVECPHCALVQFVDETHRSEMTLCCRCRSRLEHCAGTSVDAALAAAMGALLLIIPAWTLPFLTTSAFGATRTSFMPTSVSIMIRERQPALAVIVCLFIFVFPAARAISLTTVLLLLRLGKRPPWLARVFRLANALQTWAMLDVFLLGFMVAYLRLRMSIPVTMEPAAFCFMGAVMCAVVARASLDKAHVWRMIGAERRIPKSSAVISCRSCGLLLASTCEGQDCPRCGATVRARKAHSYATALALLVTAGILYFPANLYPIATIPIGITPTSYTVLGGVADLIDSHLFSLALLVFTASFTIPLLKMAGLSWCLFSLATRSRKHLVAKTRVYRIVEEIGRWSMVDPLTIACFVPVLQFNGLIDGHAQPAATPFTAVVILTTLAVRSFDLRLMWDAAREPAARREGDAR
jgi:paraquat-inducible protein A